MKFYSNSLHWVLTLIMSMALSIGTWNPTSHNFIHYIMRSNDVFAGFQLFVIVLMIVLWILAIKAIFQSLKLYGIIIITIVILTFIFGLHQYNIINTVKSIGWIVSISTGFIIWLGLNASIIWKKLTGIYTTDETID